MPRYRRKPGEVEAFKLEDGRYLIAEEPPRFVPGEAFELIYEQLPDRRKTARRKKPRAKRTGRRRRDHVTDEEVQERASLGRPRGRPPGRRKKASRNGAKPAGRKPGRPRKEAAVPTVTLPPDGDRPRFPRGKAEVDRVLDEVKTEVDRRMARDRGNNTKVFSNSERTGRRLQEGESIGTGRKLCPKCQILNNSHAKECGSCGAVFVPKGAKA